MCNRDDQGEFDRLTMPACSNLRNSDSATWSFSRSSLLAFAKTGLAEVVVVVEEWVTPWVGFGVPDPSPMTAGKFKRRVQTARVM